MTDDEGRFTNEMCAMLGWPLLLTCFFDMRLWDTQKFLEMHVTPGRRIHIEISGGYIFFWVPRHQEGRGGYARPDHRAESCNLFEALLSYLFSSDIPGHDVHRCVNITNLHLQFTTNLKMPPTRDVSHPPTWPD